MPAHDWRKVPAGIFHDFHNSWIVELRNALNRGGLPPGYYALSEQVAGGIAPDVLALERTDGPAPIERPSPRATATLEAAPPRAAYVTRTTNLTYAALRKTIAIRHISDHEVVALVEILSPANKGSRVEIEAFLRKAQSALKQGVHLLVADLFPPARLDPVGMHGALWEALGQDASPPVSAKPLLAASYEAAEEVTPYLQPFAPGDPLPEMPLFLAVGSHVRLPLEPSYARAFADVPDFWRDRVAGPSPA